MARIGGMNAKKRFHPLLMAGFVFLILASVSRWIKPHTDVSDAITGLLYGLAIGCMLLGIVKTTRGSAGPPTQTEPPKQA